MKVFVTGGTGFVGRELAHRLYDAGHTIRLLVRKPNSRTIRDLASRCAAEVHPGDVLRPDPLRASMQGADAVIHLVGIISEVGPGTFENIHIRGTQNVLAAAQQAGIRRFIHMSALGTRPSAASRYHQSKWLAEEAVRHSHLDWTIFRPSLIYGPGDQFTNLFAKIIRLSPVVPVVASPRARFQPVSVEAVAQAFVKSLTIPKSIGQTCDLCGPETFTFEEMLDRILAVMGRKRLKVRVPLWLARCQAACLEFIFPRLLRKAPPLNRDQLIMLQEDNVGNPAPANGLFDLAHVPFDQGIALVLTPHPRVL